jgi:hypothetical protein
MTAAALECQSCRDTAILTHRVNIIKLTKEREIARYTLAAPGVGTGQPAGNP